jgi:ElaB/YqjD/DUF883 family membrane-anchored ribosome-binding protein
MEARISELEESLEIANEKIARLARRFDNIDNEHARIFMVSESSAERAYVMSMQYTTMEESMKLFLKSLRKHADDMMKLRKDMGEQLDRVEAQLRFNLRVVEEELRKQKDKSDEKPEQKAWKQISVSSSLYESHFPSIAKN